MKINSLPLYLRHVTGHISGLSEQFLISITSFLTIMILARWSTSEVVGQIALIWNITTFFLLLHKSITSAFTVFAAGEGNRQQKSHLREFISIHLPIFSIVGFCFVILPIFFLLKNEKIVVLLLMSTLLIGTSLIYEAQRRIMWAFDSGANAAILAVFRTVVFALGLLIIRTLNLVFTSTLALAWMISSRLVCIPPLFQNWLWSNGTQIRSLKIYLKAYWNFCRWLLLISLLGYLAGNIYVPLVSLLLGFAKAGEFEVWRQLIAPFYIIPIGISSYLLPTLSKDYKKMARTQFNKLTLKLLISWVFIFLGFSCLLVLFGQDILELIVGSRATFYDIGNGIFALAILGFAISLNIFCVMIISATERPELGWRPMGFAVLVNGFIGVPLVVKFGVVGAFTGNALTSTVTAIMILKAGIGGLKTADH